MLVSGECLAFVFFQTVVKLNMLHYSLQEKKSLFCRLQNVFIQYLKNKSDSTSAADK